MWKVGAEGDVASLFCRCDAASVDAICGVWYQGDEALPIDLPEPLQVQAQPPCRDRSHEKSRSLEVLDTAETEALVLEREKVMAWLAKGPSQVPRPHTVTWCVLAEGFPAPLEPTTERHAAHAHWRT